MVPYAIFPHYILTIKGYFIFGLRPKYAESLLLVTPEDLAAAPLAIRGVTERV